MKRLICCIPAVALGIALSAGGTQAQTALTLGTGAGVSIPVGDLADSQGLGWNAQANVGVKNPAWPVALRFDVMYHALNGDDAGVGSFPDLRILAGTANAELYLSRAANGGGFFIVGGAGLYNSDFEDDGLVSDGESSTDFGVSGGAGYKIAMTNLYLSIESKFHNIFADGGSPRLIPINIVAEIPLGGR